MVPICQIYWLFLRWHLRHGFTLLYFKNGITHQNKWICAPSFLKKGIGSKNLDEIHLCSFPLAKKESHMWYKNRLGMVIFRIMVQSFVVHDIINSVFYSRFRVKCAPAPPSSLAKNLNSYLSPRKIFLRAETPLAAYFSFLLRFYTLMVTL